MLSSTNQPRGPSAAVLEINRPIRPRWLEDSIHAAPREAGVVLDFGHAEDFSAFELAAVALAVSRSRRTVRVRGLENATGHLWQKLGFEALLALA